MTHDASVTPSVPKADNRRDGPRARRERLRSWLDWANGEAPELPNGYVLGPMVISHLPEAWIEALKGSLAKSFESLCRSAQWVQEVLRAQEERKAPRWPGRDGLPIDAGEWTLGEMGKVALREEFRFDFVTGRLQPNLTNLRDAFRQALLDTELLRFRRCPECSRFFYAVRSDQEKTCGSENCRKKQQRSRDAEVFELFDAGKTDAQVRSALVQTRTLSIGRLKQLRRAWRSRQSRRRAPS